MARLAPAALAALAMQLVLWVPALAMQYAQDLGPNHDYDSHGEGGRLRSGVDENDLDLDESFGTFERLDLDEGLDLNDTSDDGVDSEDEEPQKSPQSDSEDETEEEEQNSDSHYITDVEDEEEGPKVNFDLAERQKRHKQHFAAEFHATLDVKRAQKTGESLGLELGLPTDYEPPFVLKVKKHGLVADWNAVHPDKPILKGDSIVKVNDITWHHNSKKFAARMKTQFMKSRKLGGRDNMELHIQRKRSEQVHRTAAQRKDKHDKDYPKQWTPEMRIPKGAADGDMQEVMGWKLHCRHPWSPVTIYEIGSTGLAAEWNRAHPEDELVEGDELTELNGIAWKHNSTVFWKRMTQQFLHTLSADRVLNFHFQRPRAVADEYEKVMKEQGRQEGAKFVKGQGQKEGGEGSEAVTMNFEVGLKIPHGSKEPLAKLMGWQLSTPEGAPVRISKVRGTGAVAEWNQQQAADKMIMPGDEILTVDGVRWGGNSQAFEAAITEEIQRKLKQKRARPLILQVQRRY